MQQRYHDKVVIVTGGSSGIGFGIAKHLIAEGATVAIFSRDQPKGSTAAKELENQGGICRYYPTDVTDEAQIMSSINAVADDFGSIDFLVNNAGCGLMNCRLDANSTPSDRWNFFMKTNAESTYLMTAHCMQYLAKGKNSAVVNISSTASQHGNWGLYGVAKAAVEGLTKSFAAEASTYGIRVNCVSPGWIETSPEQAVKVRGSGKDEWSLPPSLFNRMGYPVEIAGAVLFLLSTDASFITGQTLIVDGGMLMTDYPSSGVLQETNNSGFSQT